MYIAIDIGGTSTRVGIASSLEKIDSTKRFPTPDTLEDLNDILHNAIKPAKEKAQKVEGIGIGVAGMVDHEKQKVLFTPNIIFLDDMGPNKIVPWVKDTPIFIENDAALAGLAESHLGAGKGHDVVAYITISTGVGGTRIINGSLDTTRYSFEPGHHIIEVGGRDHNHTRIQGSFEAYASGTAFIDMYEIDPKECEDKEIWEKYAEDLTVGLHNITLLWQPDVIVLGGGVAQRSEFFLETLIKKLGKSLPLGHPVPEIKPSTLHDTNGLLGALIIIQQKLYR